MILKCPCGAVDKVGIKAACQEKLLVDQTITIINEKVKRSGLEVTLYLISKTPLMQTQGFEGKPKREIQQKRDNKYIIQSTTKTAALL